MEKHKLATAINCITEPGPDKVLTQGPVEIVESIRQKVMVSIRAHQKEEHSRQIKKCVEVVTSWGLPVRIVGLWVNERGGIEVIYDTEKHDLA